MWANSGRSSLRNALISQWQQIGFVAVKAALLFVLVVVFLRLSPRRTLSQMSVFDFVTAVAVGSIVGRVPNASDTSFAAGAATLLVLLSLHRLVTTTRVVTSLGKFLDRRPVFLVPRWTDRREGAAAGASHRRRPRLTPTSQGHHEYRRA